MDAKSGFSFVIYNPRDFKKCLIPTMREEIIMSDEI